MYEPLFIKLENVQLFFYWHSDTVVADAKRLKTSLLPDSMTGVAVYFQNVMPPSLVSKLARHIIAYPSIVFYQFELESGVNLW